MIAEAAVFISRAGDPSFIFLARSRGADWVRHPRPMEMALLPLGTDTTGFRHAIRVGGPRIVVPAAYRPLFSEFNQIFNSIRIEFIEKPEVMNRDGNFRVYLMYDSENLSGRSMMVNIIYGSTQFTFSDSYTDEEDHIYSNMNLFDSTSVLRVPASGSFDYTSPEFIIRAAPEHVVISSRNPGKKLNSEVFESTLQLSGIKVLNTKESGAVIFETDGREMSLVEWR